MKGREWNSLPVTGLIGADRINIVKRLKCRENLNTTIKNKDFTMKTYMYSLIAFSLVGSFMMPCNINNRLSNTDAITSKIVFTADNHLCIINSNEKNIQILASGRKGSFVDWEADISPNGTKLVFSSADSTPKQIYLMNLRTLHTTNITHDHVFHESPSFSPDGKSIIFLTAQGWMENIYQINIVTDELRQLTNGLKCSPPSYSPDGTKIIFSFTNARDSNGIATIDKNGNNFKLLTRKGGSPQYSKNGKLILYQDYFSPKARGLYIMNSDGSNNKFLTTIPYQTYPKLSPDGSKIVLSYFTSNYDIYIMNNDGSGITGLTTSPGREYQPSFSPDGTKIMYLLYDTSRTFQLNMMDLDGCNKKTIITDMGSLRDPTF